EMLAYQQKESTARVASIMENTNLSKQQQVSEIMRQMLTQAQTAGQYFTNDQIKEMTRKVSAEVDLVHQQTQNQRYGSSHIGATALIMFIPSTFKRPVSSWKALNLRKTLLMASSVRLKPLNCSRLPCVYA